MIEKSDVATEVSSLLCVVFSESGITCWTCPNKSDYEECNDWAPDVPCPHGEKRCSYFLAAMLRISRATELKLTFKLELLSQSLK